jgi:phage-related protein
MENRHNVHEKSGIARFFSCAHEGNMVLLHGFIKKSQKTPDREIAVAVIRMKGLKL